MAQKGPHAITDIQVRKAPPKDKPYKLSIGAGLYLLVDPHGRKYWKLKYRIAGKEKKLSLGVYPATTLAEARRGAQTPGPRKRSIPRKQGAEASTGVPCREFI